MKFQVYSIERNDNLIWIMSSDIEVDIAYWYHKNIRNISVIENQFSIGLAKELVVFFQEQTSSISSYLFKNKFSVKEVSTKQGFNILLLSYKLWKESALPSLDGRILLLEELVRLTSKISLYGNSLVNLDTLIQTGYLLGDIKIDSSVSYPYNIKKGKITKEQICNRCGTKGDIIIQPCSLCEDYCATCENCIIQGRSKSCIPLFYFHFNTSETLPNKTISIKLDKSIKYSPSQLSIANKLVEFINNEQNKEFLVWAVTGAGKTEMTFPAIRLALEQGKKVLFTAPRKDVIKDLTIRIKEAFPDVSVISIYSESKEKWMDGDFYLTTVQQTIRFINYFDLVVIDELDAYPYQNDKNLQYLVKRSLKMDAKTIFMTATPPKEWLINLKHRMIDFVVLPLRHHGKPLPVPKVKFVPKSDELLKKNKPFSLFSKFIDEVKNQSGSALIFVPRVNDVAIWTDKLKVWFNGEKIDGIHANDQNRNEKLRMFKTRDIRYLVTTTILERGVTFSNLHVLIINTEANVFDEATLIQIAGRVGRSAEYSNGLVWFLTEYMTKDIAGAVKQINKMNKLAKKYMDINEDKLW